MLESGAPDMQGTAKSGNLWEDGVDMIDLLLFVLRAKRRILMTTLVFGLLGVGIALWLKPDFTATAVIMPPQQEQSTMSSLAGQLGSLGSLGAASAIGLKNPADMYVGILQGQVIADKLIERFGLQAEYKARLRVDARARLKKESSFEAAKDGLIYIQVKDHDPNRAAQLANAYVDELYSLNARLAVGQASQRRIFYQRQLDDEKKMLADAEDALKQTQEKTGLIQLNGQAEQIIRNIASMKAQIASREVELSVAHTFATDQNPDVAELQQQIAGLKKQLSILETTQANSLPGDVQVPSGQVPAAGLDYLRKLREVRYHESLFELLSKQREAASLDEAKSVPQIQVIDPAQTPERKSGPSRALITLGFLLLGLVISSVWAIFTGVISSIHEWPEQAARLQLLQEAVGFGSKTRQREASE
jgi:uncharacterized protein involved in exopolysaccharide biosynthesis